MKCLLAILLCTTGCGAPETEGLSRTGIRIPPDIFRRPNELKIMGGFFPAFSVDPSKGQMAFGASELPDLGDLPMSVRYMDDGDFTRQTELQLFARDPQATADELGGMLKQVWGFPATAEAQKPVLVLPYTPNASFDTWKPIEYTPTHADFALDPSERVRLRGARVIKHGLCERSVYTTGELLDPVNDEFYEEFKKGVKDDGATPWRFASTVAATLLHTPGVTSDLRGGFIFNLRYHADNSSPFHANLDIFFTSKYEFGLDDGRLAVFPAGIGWDVQGYSAHSVRDKMRHGLEVKLPQRIKEITSSKQAFPIPNASLSGPALCDPQTANSCDVAATLVLTGALDKGASQLGLNADERARLRTAALARDEAGRLRNVRCAPREVGGVCEYVLRAKRINVNPDTVDLVWFDDKELDNPAYAAYVVAKAAGSENQLCLAKKPMSLWGVSTSRKMAWSGRGLADKPE